MFKGVPSFQYKSALGNSTRICTFFYCFDFSFSPPMFYAFYLMYFKKVVTNIKKFAAKHLKKYILWRCFSYAKTLDFSCWLSAIYFSCYFFDSQPKKFSSHADTIAKLSFLNLDPLFFILRISIREPEERSISRKYFVPLS